VFLHFFHDQIVATAQQTNLFRGREPSLIGRLEGAVIFAALLSDDPLRIPTVDLVQSPFLAKAHRVIEPLVASGQLEFVGSTTDIDVLQSQKRAHFADTGLHQVWNSAESRDRLTRYETALRARSQQTTADLTRRWALDVADLDAAAPAREATRQFQLARLLVPSTPSPERFQRALLKIPERLDGKAFLWNVFEAARVFDLGPAGPAAPQLERGMAYNWILSHVEEYDTRILGTIPGLNPIDFGLARTHPDRVIDLRHYDRALRESPVRVLHGSSDPPVGPTGAPR
jgi:hypothetical protein